MFNNEDYYGYSSVVSWDKFALIITTDKKLLGKYWDAISYTDFMNEERDIFDQEMLYYFNLVWNYEMVSARQYSASEISKFEIGNSRKSIMEYELRTKLEILHFHQLCSLLSYY